MARKIEVNIVGDASSYSRALKDASNQSSVFSKGLLTIGKAAAVGLGALGAVSLVAGKRMVDMASDAAEVQSKLEVTFGRALPELTKNIDKFASATGASRFALREQVADMGALLVPLSSSKQAAAEMSAQFVKLATDLGSFNNVPVDEALLAIRSGLVGEAEPLRRFGVLLNEAAVQQEGLRLGLVKGKEAMSEQEKVQARASLIMKQTTLAQGDATRTAGSFANQMKKLHNTISDAATAMGQQLLPILLPLVQRFNTFLTDLFAQRTVSAKLKFVWEGLESVATDLADKVKHQIDVLFLGTDIFSREEKMMIHVEPQIDVSGEVGAAIDQFWSGLKEHIMSGGGAGADQVEEAINAKLRAIAVDAPGRFVREFRQALNAQDIFGDLKKFVIDPLVKLGQLVQAPAMFAGEQIARGMRAGTAAVTVAITTMMSSVVTTITQRIPAAASAAANLGVRIVSGVVSGLAGIGSRVLNKLNDIIRFVATTAQNAYAAAVAIGSGIVSGIMSGISGLGSRLFSALASQVRGAIDGVKSLFGIRSPSTVTAKEIGEPLAQGVIDGWIRSSAPLPDKMADSVKRAIEKARAQIEAARERLGTAFDGMAARILRAFDAETSAIRTASEQRIDEISQRREMEDLLDRQAAAQQRLTEAIQEGDAAAIAAAQRDLARAQEDIALVDLKKKAEQERVQLDSQNEERRLALEKRLEQLKAHFEREGATTKQAMAAIVKIMKAFDVDFAAAGELVGNAFAAALRKAIQSAVSAAQTVNVAVPGAPTGFSNGPGLEAIAGSSSASTVVVNNYAPISSEKDFQDMVRGALGDVISRQGFTGV